MMFTFYIALAILGIVGLTTAENVLSEKDDMRLEAKFNIIAKVGISHVDHCPLPLNPEQRISLENAIEEFGHCLNTTIDQLFDQLDNDIQKTDFGDLTKARNYVPQMCDIFDDAIKCYRNFAPTFELCMNEKLKHVSDNIINVAPMLVESGCLRNGTRLVQLWEHSDGLKCVDQVKEWLATNDIYELFFAKPRNMENDCIDYKRLQTGVIARVNECSPEVFTIAKPILRQFCKATHCDEYITDINCYY